MSGRVETLRKGTKPFAEIGMPSARSEALCFVVIGFTAKRSEFAVVVRVDGLDPSSELLHRSWSLVSINPRSPPRELVG